MKNISIIIKHIVVTMSMVGIAHADDKWTGFYAGVDAGYVFNDVQLNSQQLGFTIPSDTYNTSSNFSTFSPGMQVGYLYQFPNSFVMGVEANVTVNTHQIDTLNYNSNLNPDVFDRFTVRDQMQTAIKGRLGRALNWHQRSFFPYLTVGASFANAELTYKNEGGDGYSTSTTQPGLLVGAGIEWAVRQHWSLRAEYYYVDYSTIKLNIPNIYGLVDPNGNAHVNLSSNNVVVALNYWIY